MLFPKYYLKRSLKNEECLTCTGFFQKSQLLFSSGVSLLPCSSSLKSKKSTKTKERFQDTNKGHLLFLQSSFHLVAHVLCQQSLVKAMVFPVVMYKCESGTIKEAECQRIDAFELWCWRRLLRVPWTARRSNQSSLKETNPE